MPVTDHPILAFAPWRRFAVLGDSIAEGLGDPVPAYADGGWATQVAGALDRARPGLAYRNLGWRGLLAEEVLEAQLDAAVEWAPDLAVVVAGGNDLLGPGFDGPGVEDALDEMVGALRARGADVVTFGLFDISRAGILPERYREAFGDRIRELAERTATVAARHGAIHVDFSRHPSGGDPSIWSADQRHLNARGHAIVVGAVLDALSVRCVEGPERPALPARAAAR